MNSKHKMNKHLNEKTLVAKGKSLLSRHPAGTVSSCLLLVLLLAGSVTFTWLHLQRPAAVTPQHTIQHPTFKPVVGDVNDPERDDPNITVQQALVPGFQFRSGGYTLSGHVLDAHSGQPVLDAVVWIDLPVTKGQPTSIPLHAVTDAGGNYQFVHLAAGTYTVVASRYYDIGDGRYYAQRIFSPLVLKNNLSGMRLPLTAISAPGRRSIVAGQAKNVVLIDLRGFYAASLLDDPLLVNETLNLRAFLRHAYVAGSIWQPYGWRPLDQYALLTGTYPSWATYDPWPHPVPWGVPDNIDTTFWFTGGRAAHLFGQESIFDVARGYGMQTSVVAGADYILSDATTRNVDLLQRSSTFDASHWLMQVKDVVLAGEQQSNGFLLYSELASLPSSDTSSSPDAQGDGYQQALLQADQTFGQFLVWLGQQGLLHNTLIVLTTSQAQANHTDADNFYGMGSIGQGTSKQTLLALSGPGACPAFTTNRDPLTYHSRGRACPCPASLPSSCGGTACPASFDDSSSFIIAPVITQDLGLPAPAEARFPSPFKRWSCS